jgi:hypothetical protein
VGLLRKMLRCHLSQTAGADGVQLRRGDAWLIALRHRDADVFPGTLSMLWHGFPVACPSPPAAAKTFFDRCTVLRRRLLPRLLEVWVWAPLNGDSDDGAQVWRDLLVLADRDGYGVLSVMIPGGQSLCGIPPAVAGEFELLETVDVNREQLDPTRWGPMNPHVFFRRGRSPTS